MSPDEVASGDPASEAATEAEELLVRFVRAGHDAGYPTADLEERALVLARALALEIEIYATPTRVDLAVGPLRRQRAYTLRVRPTPVDLAAIARLDDVVQAVADGQLEAERAGAQVELAVGAPPRPWPLVLGAYATAAAALTPVLGGGLREAGAAALVGLVVGGLALSTRRTARTEPVVAPAAAVAASFTAAVLVELGLDASAEVATLAALVTFLPGMTLTIGMRELSTDHLQSGVANTASALVQLLGLAFGVAVGSSIATSWFGEVTRSAPDASFSGVHLLAAVIAALAFTVTLRARARDALLMCVATCLALAANEVGAALFGDGAAAFVAALAVGVAGGLVGLFMRRSDLVFVVPGVLMLVPGSAGFNSVVQLLSDQTVSGLTAGFDTFVTAMSIAYGLMVSALVLPRRFAGSSAPRGAT